MAQTVSMPFESEFEVHFRSLLRRGLELIFPCDPAGRVDLDALSDRARANYLFARATVGREYASPAVCWHEGSKYKPEANSRADCTDAPRRGGEHT
jgi:hypothetical protein